MVTVKIEPKTGLLTADDTEGAISETFRSDHIPELAPLTVDDGLSRGGSSDPFAADDGDLF